jgi:hypothetical protein
MEVDGKLGLQEDVMPWLGLDLIDVAFMLGVSVAAFVVMNFWGDRGPIAWLDTDLGQFAVFLGLFIAVVAVVIMILLPR